MTIDQIKEDIAQKKRWLKYYRIEDWFELRMIIGRRVLTEIDKVSGRHYFNNGEIGVFSMKYVIAEDPSEFQILFVPKSTDVISEPCSPEYSKPSCKVDPL